MIAPRISLSELAVADILAQADWYGLQSGQRLADRWERAVTSSLMRLVRMPRLGALCEFKAKALRDIRRFSVSGFPAHLIFYQIRENKIHILRVLHGAHDLEKLFSK